MRKATPIAVTVSNGTGAVDEGSRYAEALAAPGFPTEVGADSPHVERTEVRYPAGAEADAAVVAGFLDAKPKLVLDRDRTSILVVTGPDLRGVRTTPVQVAAPTTTTTTTAPTTTTSSPVSGSTSSSRAADRQATEGYVPGPGPDGTCR